MDKPKKKKEKKEKKRRKEKLDSENSGEAPKRRKHDEDAKESSSDKLGPGVVVEEIADEPKPKDSRKHKKRKKDNETDESNVIESDKSKRSGTKDPSSLVPLESTAEPPSSSSSEKAAARKARREERQRLASQIPTADEHGIAYTKQQLRRMRKRLARGLNPIETPEEVKARLESEAQLRREEEEELAGMIHEKISQEEIEEGDSDGDEQEVAGDEDDDDEPDEGGKVSNNDNAVAPTTSHKNKRKREKPVPRDYVCQACQNRHSPAHWIYDCPQKVTVRGSNLVAKKLKGLHNPKNKIFVSGLPFDVNQKTVQSLFEDCGKIAHCKLLKFPDTGRCKGQAYVSFETEECVRKALLVNGKVMSSDKDGKKELKLKVTKALNRTATKHHTESS